jgi:hypothetical protein
MVVDQEENECIALFKTEDEALTFAEKKDEEFGQGQRFLTDEAIVSFVVHADIET